MTCPDCEQKVAVNRQKQLVKHFDESDEICPGSLLSTEEL